MRAITLIFGVFLVIGCADNTAPTTAGEGGAATTDPTSAEPGPANPTTAGAAGAAAPLPAETGSTTSAIGSDTAPDPDTDSDSVMAADTASDTAADTDPVTDTAPVTASAPDTASAPAPAAATPPPLFPAPDPDRTPSPDNIPECPAEAPDNPIGPCAGVPVYAVCNYGTTYSCICDWIHWICVGG
jgi:hypothetical protein